MDAAPLSFLGLLQSHHEQAAFHQQRFIARRFGVCCLDVLDGGDLCLRLAVIGDEQQLRRFALGKFTDGLRVKDGRQAGEDVGHVHFLALDHRRDAGAVAAGERLRCGHGFRFRRRKLICFHRREAHDVAVLGHLGDQPFERRVPKREANSSIRSLMRKQKSYALRRCFPPVPLQKMGRAAICAGS